MPEQKPLCPYTMKHLADALAKSTPVFTETLKARKEPMEYQEGALTGYVAAVAVVNLMISQAKAKEKS